VNWRLDLVRLGIDGQSEGYGVTPNDLSTKPGQPHIYPDGIKAYGHERITTPMGRRGKPVKKLRLIPAEKAFALARKFQGRFGTTVSVL
jgi:hypothetical protein